MKNQSIRKKILVFSIMITFVPLLILELIFFVLIQKNTFDTIMDSVSIYADQLADNYQNEMDKLEHLAAAVSNFTQLEVYLSSEFEDRGEALAYYLENIHPFLSSCNKAYEGTRIRVYHDKKQIRNFSFELNNGLDDFMKDNFPQGLDAYGNGGWMYTDLHYNMFHSVFTYSLVNRENTWPHEISHLITIHIDEQLFYSQIAKEPPDEKIILVMDKAGNILSSNQREKQGGSWEGLGLPRNLLEIDSGQREMITLDGKEYCCICRRTEQLDILYLVAYTSIQSAQWLSMFIVGAVGCLLMLLFLGLIVPISESITADIASLKEKMQNIDRESIHMLAEMVPEEDCKDEIKQLDIVFTKMMAKIDELMNAVQLQERKLKDEIITRQQAEITALQRQINPHYLFNTLEAIRMNLIIKNDRENAEIVKLFAESFRRYVDTRTEIVTLLEEVEFVRKYIRIQNYRLDNKIHFLCMVDEQLLSCRILKLLIQPLIENAVCHGIEQKETDGEVVLYIEKNKNFLVIRVEDDGIGMGKSELKALRETVFANQPQKSVGLHNVYHRVRLVYGEGAELNIESSEGIGTKIRLKLPLEQMEGGALCFDS